jgi:hypothetical protein
MTEAAGDGFVKHLIEAEEDDLYRPTEEEERDYWAGEGHLTFHVVSYDPTSTYCPYEIDWDDYSGCVGGLDETLGIEYAVNEGILDVGKLHIGMTYEVQGITAHFTRGDGWTTDDDVDYYVESVTKVIYPHRLLKAWWWGLIGHRIRNWRAK